MSSSSSMGSFTGFKAHEFVAHTSKTNCVAVGPRSGQVLATGGDDKRVNVWRIGRASSIWSLTGNSSAIESLRFDPTEEFLVSGSAGGAVKLFDLSAGKMTRHFRGHMSNVTVIDCGSFDRRFVTTGSMDCQVKLWNVETKECAMAFKGHNAEVTDVQFSPDGHMLASAAADGQVKLWDLRAGKPLHTFQACSSAVRAIRFNPQEFLLAVSTSDRTVKLYDIEFMELFCVSSPDTCPIRAITFDPEGQTMFCASPSGLRQWSWDNDTAATRLEAMGDVAWGKVGAGALHYNADGRQLIAASCAGSRVSVWAVDSDAGSPSSRDQRQRERGPLQGTAAPSNSSSLVEETPPQGATQTGVGATASGLEAGSPAVNSLKVCSGLDLAIGGTGGGHIDRTGTRETARSRNSSDNIAGGKPSSRCPDDKRTSQRERDSAGCRSSRYSHGGGAKQLREEDPVPLSSFQVLGSRLSPQSTRAGEKVSSPSSPSSLHPLPLSTAAAPSENTTAQPLDVSLSAAVDIVAAHDDADSNDPHRRPSRAAAVAAAVAAVASAKAATDSAVAAVSSSGRHRSVGTSISDTLVLASAHQVIDENHRCGGGGEQNISAEEGQETGARREGGRNDGSSLGRRPDHPEPWSAWAAPGKDDGRVRRVSHEGYKWHKRVPGALVGNSSGLDGQVATADDRLGDIRCLKNNRVLDEEGQEKRHVGGGLGSAALAAAGAKPSTTYASSYPVRNPWSRETRSMASRPIEDSRAVVRGAPGTGTGGDSPPLLGSPDSYPERLHQSSSPVTSSRRLPAERRSREKDTTRVPSIGVRPVPGFPAEFVASSAAAAGAKTAGDPPAVTPTESGADVGGSAIKSCLLQEGSGIDAYCRNEGNGSGELGMTRPRTATKRWDRPSLPGEDEVIAKALLSRAAVTSTLSNRLTHIRRLRSGWQDGDISRTISRLKRLERSVTASDSSPRAIVADFLSVVPLEAAGVTLEHCLELMPLLETLWKLSEDGAVAAGTRCLESVVRRFGGFVRDTLAAPTAAGRVDLAREDRIDRCREAHRAFIRGYHHLERTEREFYDDRRIAAVSERLRPLFERYFMG